jgi:hypothetical protein
MTSLLRRLAFVSLPLTLAAAGCSAPVDAADVDAAEVEAPAAEVAQGEESLSTGKVQIVVSVDWEGRELGAANLAAMKSFRAANPDVPLVQFLNAAYYFKPGANAAVTTAQIRTVLTSKDELGLHIHGWKRLFEASGVTFRSSSTFWGTPIDLATCSFDCGHEVPISSYNTAELQKVIRTSTETLKANGFAMSPSFRAGGWMASASVREALTAEGYRVDSSAANVPLLADELVGLPVVGWLRSLWGSTTSTTQPYTFSTRAGALKEIPDNGALADYVTASEMVTVFQAHKARWKARPSANTVMSIGFHLETAQRYLPRVQGAITEIKRIAAAEKIPVAFVTTAAVK